MPNLTIILSNEAMRRINIVCEDSDPMNYASELVERALLEVDMAPWEGGEKQK